MDERTQQAARLWTLAQPVVSAFVGSLVRDFSVRDDILQETAVAVMDSFERYDATRPFVAWALGIARNQVRLAQRRQAREHVVFDDAAMSQLAVAFEMVAPEERRCLGFLHDCVGKLDGRARELCDLRYARDLRPAAIADVLGMNANAVAKALQRVRDQLRECVEHRMALEGGTP